MHSIYGPAAVQWWLYALLLHANMGGLRYTICDDIARIPALAACLPPEAWLLICTVLQLHP